PSKDYIFLPDSAHPVAPLVKVSGGKDPTDGGGIYFVDVVVRKATLLERLFGGLHEGADLHAPEDVVPPGLNDSQQRQVDLSEMQRSQKIAAAVALRALGLKVKAIPTGAIVSGVQRGLPAAGKLHPSDVIVAVNGNPVDSPGQVSDAMRQTAVGSRVRFTVLRNKARTDVAVKTVAAGP